MESISKESIIELLKTVYDPELGVNIVDLGLIYDLQIEEDQVKITMTMTTPGCPMHDAIVGGVESRLNAEAAIQSVQVDVVWNPPWTPDKMSEEAKEQLSYF